MITMYGISNCDTIKRARAALEAAGIEHRFHDFRKDGLDIDRAANWIAALGLDTVLNRRGTTWRRLDPAEQARAAGEDAAALLAEHPSLVKRPVFECDGALRVGFPRAEADAVMDWLRAG